MMNREQRRKYASKIKGDKRISVCPLCGYKSLFYTDYTKVINTDGAGGDPELEPEMSIICEVCGQPVITHSKIKDFMPLHAYIPYTLDIFELALKYDTEESEEDGTEMEKSNS